MVSLKELKAITLILISGALLGSGYIFIKIALQEFAALEVAFYRAILASFTLIIFSSRRLNEIKLRKEDVKRIVPISLCGVVVFWTLLNLGVNYSTPIIASFLVCTYPLFVVLISPTVIHEKFTSDKAIGLGLGLTGAYIIVGEGQLIALFGTQTVLGDLILLLASISWAIYMLLTKRLFLNTSLTAEYLTINVFICAVVPLLLLSTIFSSPLKIMQASLTSILCVVWLGVMCSAVAFLFINKGLSSLKASNSAIALLLSPVVTIILSNVVLGEQITAYKILGGFLVLLGISISQQSAIKSMIRKVKQKTLSSTSKAQS